MDLIAKDDQIYVRVCLLLIGSVIFFPWKVAMYPIQCLDKKAMEYILLVCCRCCHQHRPCPQRDDAASQGAYPDRASFLSPNLPTEKPQWTNKDISFFVLPIQVYKKCSPCFEFWNFTVNYIIESWFLLFTGWSTHAHIFDHLLQSNP